MSLQEFLQLLHAQTGVETAAAEILGGFPPKTLQVTAPPTMQRMHAKRHCDSHQHMRT
jgi:hypothetical protein